MTSHIPGFNLTSQQVFFSSQYADNYHQYQCFNLHISQMQDAEEALSHLLSSLRAELSESFVHDHSSLADVITLPNSRIVTQRMKGESEQERWRQSFVGPFDGILGSFLNCQTCSFQVEWYLKEHLISYNLIIACCIFLHIIELVC